MSNDKYITIPYKKIWMNILDKIILKISLLIFLSASATLFFNNFKTYEANSSLEQVITSGNNDSFNELPIGVGNLLSNNQLSSKSTSLFVKTLYSFDFFQEMMSKDQENYFTKNIFENAQDDITKYATYRDNFSVAIDDYGFIDLKFKCYDWQYCENFLDYLIETSNVYVKQIYKQRAELNLDSMMQQINNTDNIAISKIFIKDVIDELIIKSRSESETGYVFPVVNKPFSNREPILSAKMFFLIFTFFIIFLYVLFVSVEQTIRNQSN